MGSLLRLLDRVFNRLVSSRYNPIYQSGPIAIGLLAIAMVTGLYLAFFYRLGEPYESVAALNASPWFGAWVRAVHRYASDLMLVAVIFHVLRLLAQRKSWGPRTFAWVSGVGLLFLLLISAWTGYVMVWDAQAQALASAGARIFDALGLFPDPISRSFQGSEGAPASFFFFNLFLHVVLPLGMVFGVWVHTSRMARATWLPSARIMSGMTACLILVSVIWPAPLGGKADLLALTGDYPLDWIFNFWIGWAEISPLSVFLSFIGWGALLSVIPWISRPKAPDGPSFNDPNICQGCTQCVQDCPYEAIQMVSLEVRSQMKTVAQVTPELCVSCGLCSASCEPMTIGPEGRKGGNQYRAAKAFLSGLGVAKETPEILIVACRGQDHVRRRLEQAVERTPGLRLYAVDGPETLHAVAYELLAAHFTRVRIVVPPARNSENKDAYMLLTDRLSGRREPTLLTPGRRDRISVHEVGEGEEDRFLAALRAETGPGFGAMADMTGASVRAGEGLATVSGSSWRIRLGAAMTGLATVAAMAAVTRIPAPAAPETGVLRLGIRLVGQSEKTCKSPTAEELAKTPRHMRASEICTYRALSYRLNLRIDGEARLDEVVRPGGLKSDRPIYVSREIEVPAGAHEVEFSLTPVESEDPGIVRLRLNRRIEFRPGRAALIHYSPEIQEAVLKEHSDD